jgi:hypothetical protein
MDDVGKSAVLGTLVTRVPKEFCTRCGLVKDRDGHWRKPADDDHARLQTFRWMAIEDAEGDLTYQLLHGEDAERFLGGSRSGLGGRPDCRRRGEANTWSIRKFSRS